jgi:hypothetical protein
MCCYAYILESIMKATKALKARLSQGINKSPTSNIGHKVNMKNIKYGSLHFSSPTALMLFVFSKDMQCDY